jgi:hypothetical protein
MMRKTFASRTALGLMLTRWRRHFSNAASEPQRQRIEVGS